MSSPPTLQTLQLDCLLEILRYVPLPECIFLRSSCWPLKTAVDEHFRTDVRSLPVLFAARYSKQRFTEYDAKFEEFQGSYREEFLDYRPITFGSNSSSTLTMWENKNIFEKHFQLENCLVFSNWTKFDGFVEFIAKYMPNITKLGLLIDRCFYFDKLPVILNLYRKQLKVLLLKKTTRAGVILDDDDIEYPYDLPFELPNEIYHSIDGLEALDELYFFSRSFSNLTYGDEKATGQQFLQRMVSKLRIVHIESKMLEWEDFRFQSEVYENLQELACDNHEIFKDNTSLFPQLKTLILSSRYDNSDINKLSPVFFPNLNKLETDELILKRESFQQLRTFQNLERIHCRQLSLQESDEVFRTFKQNRTLKFLEIRESPSIYGKVDPVLNLDENEIDEIQIISFLFPALEKLVYPDYLREFTVADLEQVRAYTKPEPIPPTPDPVPAAAEVPEPSRLDKISSSMKRLRKRLKSFMELSKKRLKSSKKQFKKQWKSYLMTAFVVDMIFIFLFIFHHLLYKWFSSLF